MSQVRLRATGSVRQTLSYDDFGLIEISYPDEETINKFNCFCDKTNKRIIINNSKIDKCLFNFR